MILAKLPRACISLLFVCLLAACQSPFSRTGPKFNPLQTASDVATSTATVTLTNRVAPEWLQPDPAPFTVGPGDKLEIEILGDAATAASVTVGPDGKIYYYLLPGLDIWGLTLPQIRELLERELAKYMAGPQVSVALRTIESKRVWLLGRLRNAGVYPVGTPVTLLEAISLAGGVLTATGPGSVGNDELADLQHSFVIRQGQLLPVDFNRLVKGGDMSQNIYLRPDDFVYLPSAISPSIYLLGAVRLPKPVPWRRSLTLISAITDAGGTIKDAYLTHVGIVRGSLSQPKLAIVNYRDILLGKERDVPLEPRDIVYVPFTPYKNLVKYGNFILDSFARAVAINEGARAVEENAVPVGVQIGIGVH